MEEHHHHQHGQTSGGVSGAMLEISLKDCHDADDLTGIERFLSNAPGVQGVHLDRTRAVAHVTIDPQATNAAALHDALRWAGYGCVCQEAVVETPAEHRHAPDAHAGHGAHMVRDMLRRFIGSAILTIPIVLYSPLGTSLFGRELAPPFGLSPALLGFVLTSIVVWWGGLAFVSSAARSLRQGALTTLTLSATGIPGSYGYSGARTFVLQGEPCYVAA